MRTKRIVAPNMVACAEAEGPRESFELRVVRGAGSGGVEHGENDQIEPLYHEAEGDDGDSGAQPGKECPLIGGMVGVVTDHCRPRGSDVAREVRTMGAPLHSPQEHGICACSWNSERATALV